MTNKNCTEVFFGLFSKLPEGNILILKQFGFCLIWSFTRFCIWDLTFHINDI